MKRTLALILAGGVLAAVYAAPVPPGGNNPVPDVSAPVAYKDLMLVLVTADGVAAVAFGDVDADGAEVAYRYRYQAADGKATEAGEGTLFERKVNGQYDPAGLKIKAGPIRVTWSKGGKDRGWVYYAPEVVQVQVANAQYFADGVHDLGNQKIEYKALDLSRYKRK
ncbi:hypothetical protein [Limnoglobus roseus]|uniref:Uncharacterized protein n=1 Tax=Limnoglobus roseus TaxID=2598579 RepID=A0A5C1ABC4_9BACT|nr:hypothetical protein [Limnoglobus roseus]QEL14328.1 hypothetical protein PX52LOC_01208 [Limnoglobus roseus]